MIYDHSDHGTLNKPMNPFPGWICQFLPCADATNNNIKRNGNCWTQHHFLRCSTDVSSITFLLLNKLTTKQITSLNTLCFNQSYLLFHHYHFWLACKEWSLWQILKLGQPAQNTGERTKYFTLKMPKITKSKLKSQLYTPVLNKQAILQFWMEAKQTVTLFWYKPSCFIM